jgi:hypothetical protein
MSDKPVPILDQPLEFTPNGIPVPLRPYFQEYVLENLDPERDAFTVMDRTLGWGGIPELRWLLRRYDGQQIRAFVQKFGWRLLPRRRFKFWVLFFQLDDYHVGERIWPH